jgi:metal-responsive CopG/Arc/MetJ family transcriptional regulator
MKKVFSFSIEERVIKDLDDFCKDGLITKSKLINKILQDFIDKNNKSYDIDKES